MFWREDLIYRASQNFLSKLFSSQLGPSLSRDRDTFGFDFKNSSLSLLSLLMLQLKASVVCGG